MSHVCIECLHCKSVNNGEYVCTLNPIETSVVTGRHTYWQCKDERSPQGACGADALNFQSIEEHREKEWADKMAKRKAHYETLPWHKKLIYKLMLE